MTFSRLLKTNWFTSKLPVFDAWAKNMCFEGGGYSQNAVVEGLAAALDLLEPELPPAKDAKHIEKYVLCMLTARQCDEYCICLVRTDSFFTYSCVVFTYQWSQALDITISHAVSPALNKAWSLKKSSLH
jgi:hypothetical protein